jgi:hypothetical protein
MLADRDALKEILWPHYAREFRVIARLIAVLVAVRAPERCPKKVCPDAARRSRKNHT